MGIIKYCSLNWECTSQCPPASFCVLKYRFDYSDVMRPVEQEMSAPGKAANTHSSHEEGQERMRETKTSVFIVGSTGRSRRGRANRLRVSKFEYWWWAPRPRNCPQRLGPGFPSWWCQASGLAFQNLSCGGFSSPEQWGPFIPTFKNTTMFGFQPQGANAGRWEIVGEVPGKP